MTSSLELLCQPAARPLVSREGWTNVFAASGWAGRPDAVILWMTIVITFILVAFGFVKDSRYARQGRPRNDELFLFRQDSDHEGHEHEEDDQEEMENGDQYEDEDCLKLLRLLVDIQDGISCILDPLTKDLTRKVQLLWTIVPELFDSALNSIISDQSNADEAQDKEHGIIVQAHTGCINAQACGSLMMHKADISRMLQRAQKQAAGNLLEVWERIPSSGLDVSVDPRLFSRGSTSLEVSVDSTDVQHAKNEEKRIKLQRIQEEVTDAIRQHHEEHRSFLGLVNMLWRIFSSNCPWWTLFHYSLFKPVQMNVLFVLVEIHGGLFWTALLLQSTRHMVDVNANALCQNEDMWGQRYRLLGLGIASALIAAVPPAMMSTIQRREFLAFAKEDSRDWRQALKAWRLRDNFLRVTGFAYSFFCIIFSAAFLANVSAFDGKMWLASSIISILQQSIVVPFLWTLLLVVTSVTTMRNVEVRQHLRRQRTLVGVCQDGAPSSTKQAATRSRLKLGSDSAEGYKPSHQAASGVIAQSANSIDNLPEMKVGQTESAKTGVDGLLGRYMYRPQEAESKLDPVKMGGDSSMTAMMQIYGYSVEAVERQSGNQKKPFKKMRSKENAQIDHPFDTWRLFFHHLSESSGFQGFFCFLIVLNAITMGLEVDAPHEQLETYAVISSLFLGIFVIEILVRAFGCPTYFWQHHALLIDVLIVGIGIIDEWIFGLAGLHTSDADLSILTVCRLFRLTRLVRIFRVVQMVRPLRVLTAAMMSAAQSLLWIVFLLLVIFYCFGLTMKYLLVEPPGTEPLGGTTATNSSVTASITTAQKATAIIDKHFGNLGECILTSAEVLLRGFEWAESITNPLLHEASENQTAGYFWFFSVIAIQICFANLVTGCFVEQLIGTAQRNDASVEMELLCGRKGVVETLKEIFIAIDTNGDGVISLEEFKVGLEEQPRLGHLLGLIPGESDYFFENIDVCAKGVITIDDFVFAIIKLKGDNNTIEDLSFDFQIRQIVDSVQKSPEKMKALHNRVARFEDRLDDLVVQVRFAAKVSIEHIPALVKRLERLEDQMARLLAALQVEDLFPAEAKEVEDHLLEAKEVEAKGRKPVNMNFDTVKKSYQLREEMDELRKAMNKLSKRVLV